MADENNLKLSVAELDKSKKLPLVGVNAMVAEQLMRGDVHSPRYGNPVAEVADGYKPVDSKPESREMESDALSRIAHKKQVTRRKK
ncbi:hypothetical protein MMIC_P1722 [Mariprofundus micogutta]|uniref:Uncharacterized protein n=1 Tax=Mariprofundus micogutta TaxID=1921010 RepID=A0A1L8CPJ0_9PROT|nr:hypothetical protein [Mariprofundus micogutta]GAV20749.1 hypothetical protein MMIC_P1722 [Mariprofundus micogutta]